MSAREYVERIQGVRPRDVDPVLGIVVGLVALILLNLLYGLATGSIGLAFFLSLTLDGLLRGLVIGLAGIGLSMTYSILSFANFSHGDYLTAGAFAGWSGTYVAAGIGSADIGALVLVGAGATVTGADLGINVVSTPFAIILGLIVAGLGTVALALFLDRVVYRPMRGESGISLLIASVGVAFALRYLIAFVFDVSKRGTTNPANLPELRFVIGGRPVSLNAHDVTLMVVAGGLMLGVHLLLQRTTLGKAMRAMADNEDLARVTGIPTERVIKATWIIGGGLTGVAGYMFILWKGTIIFNDGWLLLLLVFAAVILGGIGSIYGAIVGGIIIGLVNSLAIIWIPSDFARAAAFATMIVILLVKPQGLFSGRSTA